MPDHRTPTRRRSTHRSVAAVAIIGRPLGRSRPARAASSARATHRRPARRDDRLGPAHRGRRRPSPPGRPGRRPGPWPPWRPSPRRRLVHRTGLHLGRRPSQPARGRAWPGQPGRRARRRPAQPRRQRDGRGHLATTSDRATLSTGPVSLFDADGSAIVIHANGGRPGHQPDRQQRRARRLRRDRGRPVIGHRPEERDSMPDGVFRPRPVRRTVALHPGLAERRPEARLRDHDRRRGDLRLGDGAGDPVRGARPPRATRADRGAGTGRSATAVPPHRARRGDRPGTARAPGRLRRRPASAVCAGPRSDRARAPLSAGVARPLRRRIPGGAGGGAAVPPRPDRHPARAMRCAPASRGAGRRTPDRARRAPRALVASSGPRGHRRRPPLGRCRRSSCARRRSTRRRATRTARSAWSSSSSGRCVRPAVVLVPADVMPRNGRGVRTIGLGIVVGSLAILGALAAPRHRHLRASGS